MPPLTPPTVAYIGPHNYTIRTHPSLPKERVGECDEHTLTITYDPTIHRSQVADTLLHECLHALTANTGYSREWDEATDEAFVCRMTPALLSFIRDNPDLIRFLQKAT